MGGEAETRHGIFDPSASGHDDAGAPPPLRTSPSDPGTVVPLYGLLSLLKRSNRHIPLISLIKPEASSPRSKAHRNDHIP